MPINTETELKVAEQEPEMELCLMSVKVIKNKEGNYETSFTAHGSTVNVFTFGTDEEEAKARTSMLIDSMSQGMEYVQNTVREQYAQTDESAIEEPKS